MAEIKTFGEPLAFDVDGKDALPITGAPNLDVKGVLIPDDPGIISGKVRQAIVDGWYEGAEANELQNLIAEGERILEVGSAIGFLSTLMSRDRRVKEILCFEANPKLVEFSRRVHEINGAKGIRIENAILTTDASLREVKFNIHEEFWASSTSSKIEMQSEIVVPTRLLADVIADFRPTMIVCDIEGGEVELLANAELPGVRTVLVELHTWLVGLRGIKVLFDALSRNDLVYEQKSSSRKIVSFRRIE